MSRPKSIEECSRPGRWKGGKKAADRRSYLKNYPQRKEHTYALRKLLKSAPCTDCKQSYPTYVMDFDHVRGEKRATINELFKRWAPVSTILTEVAKCELVCANCHRIRTHNRAQEKLNG